MGRVIRFRGIRLYDRQDWVYGYLSDSGTICVPDGEYTDIDANYSVNPETVGQFTGLKDKNGTDIYEGDIVEITKESLGEFYTVIATIIWGPKGSWHPEGTACDNLQEFLQDTAGRNCSKVTGNIHQKQN